ncbi:MAG: ferritin-like domain-containing protein [Pseudomonadota bacterium]
MDDPNITASATDKASEEINSRREFFAKTSLFSLGALAALTLGRATPGWAATQSTSTQDDITILNAALAHEYQAIAAYQVGAESGLLQKAVLDVAVKFQGHHKAHAQVLSGTIEKLGGTAVKTKTTAEYAFPVSQLKSQADVLQFAAGLEKGAASAYLGALPKFHNKDLISAAGSILGDETMHWAILLNALGQDPVPVAFIG